MRGRDLWLLSTEKEIACLPESWARVSSKEQSDLRKAEKTGRKLAITIHFTQGNERKKLDGRAKTNGCPKLYARNVAGGASSVR